MLARLARTLPLGDSYVYEPKWDGFRCIAACRAGNVDMRSRNDKRLARYFPEIVDGLGALGRDLVVDGEIVVFKDDKLDFASLLQRLHPAASRVELLRRQTPACFIAFDLLELDGRALLSKPFGIRRAALEEALRDAPAPLRLTPATSDPHEAEQWLDLFSGAGIDGVVAKDTGAVYLPGKRALVKVKRERTADCVVAAFRWHYAEPVIGSLLLGLYNSDTLSHVGLAASFTAERRRTLTEDVVPYVTELEGHPWEHGFNVAGGPVGRLPGAASRWAENGEITFVPLQPMLVAEVSYDHFEGDRFRHPPRFKRWRPDRDPHSCTYDQFAFAARPLTDVL